MLRCDFDFNYGGLPVCLIVWLLVFVLGFGVCLCFAFVVSVGTAVLVVWLCLLADLLFGFWVIVCWY